ncbi:uncharacterized protein BO96DRAFT_226120 [Aspergillus niger CBS 101883]|uniref:uncharacterized protein n=1 Tax=Aspergillus lacticoffeatus (strain CBS 101883) TaxID=1450533 RepID=UPI000D7EDC23|nr:uncharacterized protein BO96DRAFT_226120 [Aspergillus niger CBS 101883]PYH58776.1 hypothetical protein BO96DRAFT_226120 [Aspergillus niger CBS 101883]
MLTGALGDRMALVIRGTDHLVLNQPERYGRGPSGHPANHPLPPSIRRRLLSSSTTKPFAAPQPFLSFLQLHFPFSRLILFLSLSLLSLPPPVSPPPLFLLLLHFFLLSPLHYYTFLFTSTFHSLNFTSPSSPDTSAHPLLGPFPWPSAPYNNISLLRQQVRHLNLNSLDFDTFIRFALFLKRCSTTESVTKAIVEASCILGFRPFFATIYFDLYSFGSYFSDLGTSLLARCDY